MRVPSVRFTCDGGTRECCLAHTARADMMLMTPEEFLVLFIPDGKAELVRGEVHLTPPAGAPHGRVATNIVARLLAHVEPRGLGWVFADGAGYLLSARPRTARAPDASFVRADRYPSGGYFTRLSDVYSGSW